ncbi:MAG: hypothetical protein ABI885_21070 [Gammaproteobacteria bacterium]
MNISNDVRTYVVGTLQRALWVLESYPPQHSFSGDAVWLEGARADLQSAAVLLSTAAPSSAAVNSAAELLAKGMLSLASLQEPRAKVAARPVESLVSEARSELEPFLIIS